MTGGWLDGGEKEGRAAGGGRRYLCLRPRRRRGGRGSVYGGRRWHGRVKRRSNAGRRLRVCACVVATGCAVSAGLHARIAAGRGAFLASLLPEVLVRCLSSQVRTVGSKQHIHPRHTYSKTRPALPCLALPCACRRLQPPPTGRTSPVAGGGPPRFGAAAAAAA